MKREELLSKFKQLTAEKAQLNKKTYTYVIDKPCMQLGKIAGMMIPAIKTAYCVIDEMTGISDKAINELGININMFTEEEKLEYSSFEGFTRDQWVNDLKTRVTELQDNRRLENLDKALPIIEKWLSDDDLFTLDMEKIDIILANI